MRFCANVEYSLRDFLAHDKILLREFFWIFDTTLPFVITLTLKTSRVYPFSVILRQISVLTSFQDVQQVSNVCLEDLGNGILECGIGKNIVSHC